MLLSGVLRGEACVATVIGDAALANAQDGTNWAAFGRTFSEDHYSPLARIAAGSLKRLGLVNVSNSITAPLEVDGVVYLGAGHRVVYAVDVRTGRQLGRYDAQAPQAAGKKLRVAWGIRGIAFWQGRVYGYD